MINWLAKNWHGGCFLWFMPDNIGDHWRHRCATDEQDKIQAKTTLAPRRWTQFTADGKPGLLYRHFIARIIF